LKHTYQLKAEHEKQPYLRHYNDSRNAQATVTKAVSN